VRAFFTASMTLFNSGPVSGPSILAIVRMKRSRGATTREHVRKEGSEEAKKRGGEGNDEARRRNWRGGEEASKQGSEEAGRRGCEKARSKQALRIPRSRLRVGSSTAFRSRQIQRFPHDLNVPLGYKMPKFYNWNKGCRWQGWQDWPHRFFASSPGVVRCRVDELASLANWQIGN